MVNTMLITKRDGGRGAKIEVEGFYIEVWVTDADPGTIQVMSDDRLIVEPAASNHIRIRAKR